MPQAVPAVQLEGHKKGATFGYGGKVTLVEPAGSWACTCKLRTEKKQLIAEPTVEVTASTDPADPPWTYLLRVTHPATEQDNWPEGQSLVGDFRFEDDDGIVIPSETFIVPIIRMESGA